MLVFDLRLIGERLFALRKKLGMTQSDVAASANLSERTYADIERGSTNMRIETLLQICNALRITPDEILTQTTEVSDDALFSDLIDRLGRCTEKEKHTAMQLLAVYLDSL